MMEVVCIQWNIAQMIRSSRLHCPSPSHQHQTNWKQVLIFNGEYKFEKQ